MEETELGDEGECSEDTSFAVQGPCGVARRPPVDWEVREEVADAIQTRVGRHVRAA